MPLLLTVLLALSGLLPCALAEAELADPLSVTEKELDHEKVVDIENAFYRIRIAPSVGGSIKSFVVKATGHDLTWDTGIGNDIGTSGWPGNMNMPYQYQILRAGPDKALVELSHKDKGDISTRDLLWKKRYAFSRGSPVVHVAVEVVNGGPARRMSYRVHSLFRAGREFDTSDVYFGPGEEAGEIREIPIEEKRPGNCWFPKPKGAWAGVIDTGARSGVVVKTGPEMLDQLYMYLGNVATIEWFYALQALRNGGSYFADYLIVPVTDVGTVKEALRKADALSKRFGLTNRVKNPEKATPIARGRDEGLRIIVLEHNWYNSAENFQLLSALKTLGPEAHILRCASLHSGFPVFLEDLCTYDVIVVIDVPGWAYLEQDLANLEAFVKQGGTCIFLEEHTRGYPQTFLRKLPIVFNRAMIKEHPWRKRSTTDHGPWLRGRVVDKAHPITRGLPEAVPPMLLVQASAAALFSLADGVHDWPGWIADLRRQAGQEAPSPGKRVWELMDPILKSRLESLKPGQEPSDEAKAEIINGLNRLLGDDTLYDEEAWEEVELPQEATLAMARLAEGVPKARTEERRRKARQAYEQLQRRLNRLLLEAAFPEVLERSTPPGTVLMRAGDHPALAIREYGKGRFVSMPIWYSYHHLRTHTFPFYNLGAGGYGDQVHLLTWSLYDDLWRQLIRWATGRLPPVDFTALEVPPPFVRYPTTAKCAFTVANFSDVPRRGAIACRLTKDGKPLSEKDLAHDLREGAEKTFRFAQELGFPRGKYEYSIVVQDEKGKPLAVRDGSFVALPKTCLQAEMPGIKVFGRGTAMRVGLKVGLPGPVPYEVRAAVLDFRGDELHTGPSLALKPGREATELTVAVGNLMKGDYRLRLDLVTNGKTVDRLLKRFSVAPSIYEEDLFPVVMMSGPPARLAEWGMTGLQLYNWGGFGQSDCSDLEQAQRLGMMAIPSTRHGDESGWNRFHGGTDLAAEPGPEALANLAELGKVIDACPRLPMLYICDEPHVVFDQLHQPGLKTAFRKKHGFDLPTFPEGGRFKTAFSANGFKGFRDRHTYTAWRFATDLMAESLAKGRRLMKQRFPKIETVGCLNWHSMHAGVNAVKICANLDHPCPDEYHFGAEHFNLAYVWSAANFEDRIWGVGSTGKIMRGRPFYPQYAGTQMYNCLLQNGKGIIFWAYDAARGLQKEPERLRCSRRAFEEFRHIGPLFKHLSRHRAKVALLYPWTSAVLSQDEDQPGRHTLRKHYHILCEAFGQVDILHEQHILDGVFLDDYPVLVLDMAKYLPEAVMKRVAEWVGNGGTLLALPQSGVYNELLEQSDTLTGVFSAHYGQSVTAQVKGVTNAEAKGLCLVPEKAEVLHTYGDGRPAITTNAHGRGRATLFGFHPTGPDIFRELVPDDVALICRASKPDKVFTALFDDRDGPARYIVAVSQVLAEQSIDVRTALPNTEYYVYDLLTGERLGSRYEDGTLVIPLRCEPLWGRTLAVLPSEPARLTLELGKDRNVQGGKLEYEVTLHDKAGNVVDAKLPVSIRVLDSEKRERPEYGGVRVLRRGRFANRTRLADNEPVGKWEIEVTERLSRASRREAFSVEARGRR